MFPFTPKQHKEVYKKTCANPGCGITFTTTKANVKYHSDYCRELTKSMRKADYNRHRSANSPEYQERLYKRMVKKREEAKKEKENTEALKAAEAYSSERGGLLIKKTRMETYINPRVGRG